MSAVELGLACGLFTFALVWVSVTYSSWKVCKKPGWSITFTPNHMPFEPRHDRYQKVAEVITTLSSASLVFVPGSKLAAYPRLSGFALVLLGLAVLYCVLFMALLTFFYERFLYDNSLYKPWKYGLVNGLGFGGLVCFALHTLHLPLALPFHSRGSRGGWPSLRLPSVSGQALRRVPRPFDGCPACVSAKKWVPRPSRTVRRAGTDEPYINATTNTLTTTHHGKGILRLRSGQACSLVP